MSFSSYLPKPNRFLSFLSSSTLLATIAALTFAIPESNAQQGPASDADLSVKKLQVAPGLKVELFAAEPLLQNPVAFSIDERGRFFIAESHRWKDSIFDVTKETNWLLNDLSFRTVEDRAAFLQKQFSTNLNLLTKNSEIVRMVEDRDGDGRAETSSILGNSFNQSVSGVAAGILARKGEIWFTCIPDLSKISIDGKDFFQTNSAKQLTPKTKLETLASGFGVHVGVSGHDLHGLAIGPDGKIYFSSGDRGFSVHTKEGKFLNNPDSGGVLRCNQDGSNLEIFATGLRNPQELAFDQFGNLFTDDNDTAGEDPSRVIYIVEGGDYGWRASYQFMEGYGPWVQEKNWLGGIDGTLPFAGEVAQGPSGLAFNPGNGLPEKYRNHFLVCDFPKGIWSFAVKPKGAGFEVVDKEKFLWNLGPTDVEFGPDGSVYACDWGTSYSMPDNGRIFRIFNPAQKENAALAETKKLLATGMEKQSIADLTRFLGHENQRVRLESQFELAKRALGASDGRSGTESIENVLARTAIEERATLPRVHAIWALAQIGEKRPEAVRKIQSLLKGNDPEVIAQTAAAFGKMSDRTLTAAITPLLLSTNARVQFFAATTLGKQGHREAMPALLNFIQQNADRDPYLVHAGVHALAQLGELGTVATNGNASIRRASLLALRRLGNPNVAKFLNDTEPKLVLEAARAINDVLIDDALPNLAALLNRNFSEFKTNEAQQILHRAINSHFRLGQNSSAIALSHFAADKDAPESMRAETLSALSDWEHPSQLDRVMGLWRPLAKRDVAVAQNAFHAVAGELFKSRSEQILLATVHCARDLKMNEPALFPLFESSQSPAVRVGILETLSIVKSDLLPKAVEIALADGHAQLRAEGIKSVALLSPEKTPVLLDKLLGTETSLRIQQTAYGTLGQLHNAASTDVLLRQMDLLLAGKTAPELQLDLLDAAQKHSDTRLIEKLNKLKNTTSKEDALAEFRTTLVGGDAARGKKIFFEREDVACLRCHAISGQGGNVGPDLTTIAAKQSRDYLLESVAYPNRQIAAGFENIIVRLKNMSAVAGLVKSENTDELILNSPEDGIVKIKKSDIESRERGLSPMPEGMANVLTKLELRDLIEFLASLK